MKITRSFLNPGCTAEATVAEFPPCIAEVEVILLLSPAVVATLRSNKSVFPLQTTYAVALTLPSSLRYQAGSQGRVENEMPGRPGVRGWEGRGATLFVPSFLTISSIHRRLFFPPPSPKLCTR